MTPERGTEALRRDVVVPGTRVARLALLLPTDGQRIRGHESTIALAGALLLAFWISVEPVLRERALAFSPYTIPDLALIVGAFALSWLLVRLSDPAPQYRRVLLLTLGVMPVAIFASLAAEELVGKWFLALIVGFTRVRLVYFASGYARSPAGNSSRPWLPARSQTTAFVAGVDYLRVNPSLWVRADENLNALDATAAEWARWHAWSSDSRPESTPRSRDHRGQASPAPEVFFVGFAGYGMEQVFAREIELAARVVGARYDVGARSLLLVNDSRDLEKWPLASARSRTGNDASSNQPQGVWGPARKTPPRRCFMLHRSAARIALAAALVLALALVPTSLAGKGKPGAGGPTSDGTIVLVLLESTTASRTTDSA